MTTVDGDPSARFTAAFEAAAARMRGLPLVNPAIRVEAVGFAPWGEHWLGVMVTPWCMNLVLAPRNAAAWQPLAEGAKREYRFPAGGYEFVGACDEIAGDYLACSLFSPMHDFADHETARFVAATARAALLDAGNAPEDAQTSGGSLSERGGTSEVRPLAALQAAASAPISKRDFLRGRFLGARRDDRG
jgi:[NiFe] hydrogenase assembly HybE family chaperone